MELEEYRKIIKNYFHESTFPLSPEEDKEKVSDNAIINRIVKEDSKIGEFIFLFALQDDTFFTRSMYYSVTDTEIEAETRKSRRILVSHINDKDQGMAALERLLKDNKDRIDYRKLLLNTIVAMDDVIQGRREGRTLSRLLKERFAAEEGSFGKDKTLAGRFERLKKEIIESLKEFKPTTYNPEMYMLELDENISSEYELRTFTWDEIMEGKNKRKPPVDVGLDSTDTKNIERLLILDDIRLIPDNFEYSEYVEKLLATRLNLPENATEIDTEVAVANIKAIIRRPDYQREISPAKYHYIALYRVLEYIESYVHADKQKFDALPEKDDVLRLAKKLKGLVDKDKKEGRGIDGAFVLCYEPDRLESQYRYDDGILFDDDGDPISPIDRVDLDDISNFYNGITAEYAARMIKDDPIVLIDLYKKKLISEVNFVEHVKKLNERDYVSILNKAYEKKVIDEKNIKEIIKNTESMDEEKLRRLGMTELKFALKHIKEVDYRNNAVLNEMLSKGIINQDLLIEQYFNGMLKIEDLTNFAKYIENSEALRDTVDYSKIKFNPEVFAQVYTQLNLKKIVNILVNKEKFSKDSLAEFKKERPYLIKECTPEQLTELQKIFILQRNLLKQLNNQEQKQFMDSLGYVACIHGIAFDLFDKGIISKGIAEQYGGTEFIEQFQKTQLIDGLRHNDLESIQNLINAYNHGRISLSKILRRYVEGTLKSEIYFAFKENRDMTDAIDMPYLLGLYDKYNKTGKKEDLEILQKYYEEFKSIVKDEELLEIINKKQLELINSRKNKNSVVTMARSGVIDKDNIVMMDLETIAQLIMSGNTLNRETAKKIFRDIDGTTKKRDKLEELFKMEILTQDEMFTILSSVYLRNEESTPEQKEIDENNMAYFMEKEYFESQYGEMGFKGDPTRHNKKGVGVIKNEQQRFPIKQRIEFLYSLDTKDSVNYKAGPAIIIQLPGKNKVIIETFGTPGKNGAKTESDLTNHCTYIVDRDVFEDIKSDIFEEKVAMTKKRRQEIESVLMYRKLIDLYNEHGKEIGMKRFRHNQYWEKSLLKYFEEPEVKEQKEVNKDDKDIDD